jgi:hypothetical protein
MYGLTPTRRKEPRIEVLPAEKEKLRCCTLWTSLYGILKSEEESITMLHE